MGMMLYFFIAPTEVSAATKDGLTLWFASVVPALLPFFILSNLCMTFGVAESMGKIFRPVTERLFHLPGEAAFIMVTGYSTGAPVSAGLIASLRKAKKLTKRQAEDMLGLCTNVSPLFILSVVAESFLGQPQLGLTLASIHYGSNLILGFILGFTREKVSSPRTAVSPITQTPSLGKALSDAVYHGVSTINLIGGLMIVFIILLTMMDTWGITSMFNALIHTILPQDMTGLFHGIWEMTIGTKELSQTASLNGLAIPFISAILAFGGISTTIQVQSQIRDTDLTLKRYLPYKISQSILAFLLALFLPIKKQAVTVSGSINAVAPPDLFNYQYPVWSLAVLAMMGISLALLHIQLRKKQRAFWR